MDLNRTIVIVGYGPGIGAAVAEVFAVQGYSLALVARNPDKLAQAVARYAEQGIRAHGFPADVGDAAALASALDRARQACGDPEVVLYNAANWRPGPVLATTPDSLDADFRVCVTGALVAARSFAPAMVEAGKGTLLFTGGGFALYPSPQAPGLSIGKAGVRSLALMLAAELAPSGVGVTTVTVAGTVAEGTPFAPSRIAAAFWAAHSAHAAAECVFDGTGSTGWHSA